MMIALDNASLLHTSFSSLPSLSSAAPRLRVRLFFFSSLSVFFTLHTSLRAVVLVDQFAQTA